MTPTTAWSHLGYASTRVFLKNNPSDPAAIVDRMGWRVWSGPRRNPWDAHPIADRGPEVGAEGVAAADAALLRLGAIREHEMGRAGK